MRVPIHKSNFRHFIVPTAHCLDLSDPLLLNMVWDWCWYSSSGCYRIRRNVHRLWILHRIPMHLTLPRFPRCGILLIGFSLRWSHKTQLQTSKRPPTVPHSTPTRRRRSVLDRQGGLPSTRWPIAVDRNLVFPATIRPTIRTAAVVPILAQ